MSKRFKCNIYTKCYCFLKFLSAGAQNLPGPRGSSHLHSYAEQVPLPEPPVSSPRGWCLQRWELQSRRSSSVSRDPACGTFLQNGSSAADDPAGSCSGCLHHLPHIAAQPVSPITSRSWLDLPPAALSPHLALQICTSVPPHQ